MLLPSICLKIWLIKVKTSKITSFFAIFYPKWANILTWFPSNMVFVANLAFNFHPGISITTICCLYMYTSCKIWKPLKHQFLFLFTTLDLIWPKFCPKDHTHITFLGWFPMKYVRAQLLWQEMTLFSKKTSHIEKHS